jgi:hypothetical protein
VTIGAFQYAEFIYLKYNLNALNFRILFSGKVAFVSIVYFACHIIFFLVEEFLSLILEFYHSSYILLLMCKCFAG